jgi:hypothetical protein
LLFKAARAFYLLIDDFPFAQIAGVHYEGVIASEKIRGSLPPQFFKMFKTGYEI